MLSRNLNLKKILILASLSAILTIIDHPLAIAVNESNADLCSALFTETTPENTFVRSTVPPVRGFLRHGREITMLLTIGDKSRVMDDPFAKDAERLIGELTGMTRLAKDDPLRDPFGDPATRAATQLNWQLAKILNEAAGALHIVAHYDTDGVGNFTKARFRKKSERLGQRIGTRVLRELETALNMLLNPRLKATVRIEFPRARRDRIPIPQGYHLRITIGMGAPDNIRSQQTEQILRALRAFSYSRLSDEGIIALANSPIMRGLYAINRKDGYVLTGINEEPYNHFFVRETGEVLKEGLSSSTDSEVNVQIIFMPATDSSNPQQTSKPIRIAYLIVKPGPDGAHYVRTVDLPSVIMEPTHFGSRYYKGRRLSWGGLDLETLLYQPPPTTPQPL